MGNESMPERLWSFRDKDEAGEYYYHACEFDHSYDEGAAEYLRLDLAQSRERELLRVIKDLNDAHHDIRRSDAQIKHAVIIQQAQEMKDD